MISAIVAKIAASVMFGRVKRIADAVPRWLWFVLIGAGLLGLAVIWHQRIAHRALDGAYSAGEAAANGRWSIAFDRMQGASDQWRANYAGASRQLSVKIGELNEAENRADAARADALRLYGPGRAAAPRCRSEADSGLSARAGQPVAPGGGADDGLAGVPADEPMAIVPWGDLVGRAETADANRREVRSWRLWYDSQAALLAQMKRDLEASAAEAMRER